MRRSILLFCTFLFLISLSINCRENKRHEQKSKENTQKVDDEATEDAERKRRRN